MIIEPPNFNSLNMYLLLCFFLLIQSVINIAEKLNVLLIIVDDLRPLSDVNISLPHTENLAANGINFENAFAQALCAPSRNSLLTGRRPDAIRLYDFYSYWRQAVGNYTTLPQYFKEKGYITYSVGKIFHPGKSSGYTDDYPYSWSYYPYHPPTEKYKDAAVCKDRKTKKYQRNLVCPVNVKKQPRRSLPDLETLAKAIDILEKGKNCAKPFLLAVGFHKPHVPLKFPKDYLKRFPKHNIMPPHHPERPNNMPEVAWHPWTDIRSRDDIKNLNIPFPYGIMPKKWSIKIRRSYYAASAYVDDIIGKLLQYVDKRNTVVVLTSDHGWSLGENGLWAKYSNFDAALRVPLIFNAPGLSKKTINTPVELLDVFPTVVQLAGLKESIPRCNISDNKTLCFAGKSLVPLMTNVGTTDEVNFAISQYPRPSDTPQYNSDKPRLKDIKIMGYSIRTKRYRYTEWVAFNNKLFTRNWNKIYGIELYDHIVDSNESNNLCFKLEYKYIQKYLSNLLRLHVDTE